MDRFRLTRTGDRKANDESQQSQDSLAEQEHLAGADRVIGYLSTAEEAPPDSESGSRVVTENDSVFDRLGEYVSSVMSAAKAAAVRIEEESRQEAERVRDLAQREATESLEAAREDADATRTGAERLRSETEEWTKQARTAAEKSAADRRAEAEAEAREIVAAAERHAASISEQADQRQEALKRDSSLVEERLRQLATALHDLAERLDTLLSTPPQAQEGGADDQSLIDALGPSRETEEARMQ
jgi:DNA repair exonuclease SbcCD ATPase subunit